MLLFETLIGSVSRKSILSFAYPAIVMLLLIPLTGCADEQADGPVPSNLSAPTNATGALD